MRKSLSKTLGIVLTLSLGQAGWLGLTATARADSLWLGNDTGGNVYETDTTGTIIRTVPATPMTGVAFDGTNLYFSDSVGNITKRTADGATILDSFFIAPSGHPSEDMAWDTKRQRLWRIDHNLPQLEKINPGTHSLDADFPLPNTDPNGTLSPLGGLGVAYDSRRDLLYVSYCMAGCATLAAGLVETVDPNTGNVLGVLFRTNGFATGGLGYDPVSDTLWVGDNGVVRNMTLNGAVLSSFNRTGEFAGFTDGLEFISTVPEPTGAVLALIGSLGLLGTCWRSYRQRVSA